MPRTTWQLVIATGRLDAAGSRIQCIQIDSCETSSRSGELSSC